MTVHASVDANTVHVLAVFVSACPLERQQFVVLHNYGVCIPAGAVLHGLEIGAGTILRESTEILETNNL